MHAFASVSLKNRAFTALVVIVTSILGVASLLLMRQELIPSVALPQVQVVATEPGASSEQMHERIAQPIEESIQSLDHVDSTRSTSVSSVTTITIELTYGTDTARSANQIEAALNRLELPENAETQVISGGTGDLPAAVIAISSDLEPYELAARLNDQVVPELERISGLAQVSVIGGPTQIIRITPDRDALARYALSEADIIQALDDNGLSIPAGQVSDSERTLDVTVGRPLDSVDALAAIPVLPAEAEPSAASTIATLGDIANVEHTIDEPDSVSRTNGRDSLVLVAIPTSDANLVQVSSDIEARLAQLTPDIGGNAAANVVFDQGPFITNSIQALAEEGVFGLGFAIAVILIFLLAVRPTIVTAVSIPVSILMAFVGMYVSGYSLNMLTLAALTISIGRVVDDSIVVIENITRHLQRGLERTDAILTAVREVGAAITASTLATVIVFLPIAVVDGMAGELFRPFSLTVAIAMLASLVVALTIVPVLAYWFLRAPRTHSRAHTPPTHAEHSSWMIRLYRPTLAWTQRHAIITLALSIAVLVGTIAMFPLMKINLLSDSGQNIASYTQSLPTGTSLEATSDKAAEVETAIANIEGVETVQSTIGGSRFGFRAPTNEVDFSITTDIDADQEALRARILEAMRAVPESGDIEESSAMQGPLGSNDVTIEVTAATAEHRAEATELLLAELGASTSGSATTADLPGSISRITSDLEAAQPTAVITVDRVKAAERGLSDGAVVGLVAQQLQPQPVGSLSLSDRDLSIYLDRGPLIETFNELETMELLDGIALRDVASIDEELTRPTVRTINNRETVTVSLTPASDNISAVSEEAQRAIDAVQAELPDSARLSLGGAAADVEETFTQLAIAILAAILLTYVLLVWIFKSLVQPLILLVSIPFAATGSFALLIITQVPLGLPAMIGLLMLIGIVVSNAIVLIDLVNQRRASGMDLDEAIMTGAMTRLRPILMTAAATIFALVPMAIGITGQEGFISQPLAVVTIGGLVSSTLLTLVVVPVLYRLTEARGQKRRRAKAT